MPLKVKKPRKKKKWNANTRITSALRKIWLYSPMRREAVKRGKDNGSKCEKCGNYQEHLEVDHFNPVVGLAEDARNWDVYISRLFCEADVLQNLCTSCHQAKTAINREQRKRHKKMMADKSKLTVEQVLDMFELNKNGKIKKKSLTKKKK